MNYLPRTNLSALEISYTARQVNNRYKLFESKTKGCFVMMEKNIMKRLECFIQSFCTTFLPASSCNYYFITSSTASSEV